MEGVKIWIMGGGGHMMRHGQIKIEIQFKYVC